MGRVGVPDLRASSRLLLTSILIWELKKCLVCSKLQPELRVQSPVSRDQPSPALHVHTLGWGQDHLCFPAAEIRALRSPD
jgi:hypothetical protein